MAEILGLKLPTGTAARKIAAVAIVSVPVAAVAIAGYAVVRGARALRDRFTTETPEEIAARLERAHREGEVR
jgi:hypothetical protein